MWPAWPGLYVLRPNKGKYNETSHNSRFQLKTGKFLY
jgi:hypothetical protein